MATKQKDNEKDTGTPPPARDMKKKKVRTPILQEPDDTEAQDSGKQGSTGSEESKEEYTSRYPAEGGRVDSFHNEGEREYDKDPHLRDGTSPGEQSPENKEGSPHRQNTVENQNRPDSPVYGSQEQGPNRSHNRNFENYERGYRDGSRHASRWYNERNFEIRNLYDSDYDAPAFQGSPEVHRYDDQFENRPGRDYHPEYLEQYPEFRGRGSYRYGEDAGERRYDNRY